MMEKDCGSVTGSDLLRNQDKTEAPLDVPSHFRWGECIKDQREVKKLLATIFGEGGVKEEREGERSGAWM